MEIRRQSTTSFLGYKIGLSVARLSGKREGSRGSLSPVLLAPVGDEIVIMSK